MPDLMPWQMGSLYGLAWLGIARLAVATWRANEQHRRLRASREIALMRLWRWKDC
jgi:hypothetical protein